MKKGVIINIRGTKHFDSSDFEEPRSGPDFGSLLPKEKSDYLITATKLPEGTELDDFELMSDEEVLEEAESNQDIAEFLKKTIEAVSSRESTTELSTEGELTVHNDGIELSYSESNITGMEGAKTSIFFSNNGVATFSRTGKINTHMVFENKKRYFCICPDASELPVAINTSDMDVNLSENGGRVHIDFSVEVGGSLAEHNEYYIDVT